MILDLHGYTEQEAIGQIYTTLMTFDESEFEELEIITGKGFVLTRVVEEILDDELYVYKRGNPNTGSYIVYK